MNSNIPGVLLTLNTANSKDLETLQKLQSNEPKYISEFLMGSYYRYEDKYHARDKNSEIHIEIDMKRL
jgi:predicted ATP-dependent Lon-type protease